MIKVEKVKDLWKVFDVQNDYGVTFKTLVAEHKNKQEAINIAAEKGYK